MKSFLFLLSFALLGMGASEVRAQPCRDAVQGKIAWNYENDTKWAPQNVQRLCEGAEDSREPARCFEQVMHGGVSWGRDTRWEWENALELCQGTRDADVTVSCFEGKIADGLQWSKAIDTCQWNTDFIPPLGDLDLRPEQTWSAGAEWAQVGGLGDITHVAACKDIVFALAKDGRVYQQLSTDASGDRSVTHRFDREIQSLVCNQRLLYLDGSRRLFAGTDQIGRPYDAADLAASEPSGSFPSKYYALNDDRTLWENPGTPEDEGWRKIGRPADAKRIAATRGLLFALNDDGSFYVTRKPSDSRYWHRLGIMRGAVDIATVYEPDIDGAVIFAVSENGHVFRGEVHDALSIWKTAGQDDFLIHPQSSAEHFVTGVQGAFEAIEFGRSRGKNFFSDRIWGADRGGKSHMQGVARLPGGWLVQSYSEGAFLTHFPSKDGSEHSVWARKPDHGHPHVPQRLNPTFNFKEPKVAFDEPRVDWCRNWGNNCGKSAADRFCRQKGFTGSTDFAKDVGVDYVTQVLAGDRRCDGSERHCDSFKSIKCVAEGAVTREKVGGVHAYHDIVVVPSRTRHGSRVELFEHSDGNLTLLSKFEISEHQSAAHYASILPLNDGDWLLAVGHDSRKRRKPHRIHFYVIPSLTADQSKLRYLGRWGRGRTRDDFQSASLIAGSSGDVFIIGTGTKGLTVVGRKHAKLYKVLSFTRSDGGRPRVEVTKLKERDPRSERNDCNLNAGATFFPTSDHALLMYCTEKEISNGQITTREYRDEDGG